MAQGIIMPTDNVLIRETILPRLISHKVQVDIQNQAATVEVEQVYLNPGNSTIEGIYYFPLTDGAMVSNFAMYVNGKRLEGEIIEKEEAIKLYEDIVRKRIDPALLEFVNHKLYCAKIFPISPKEQQKITLKYSEILKNNNSFVKFLYPLRGKIQEERPIPGMPANYREAVSYEKVKENGSNNRKSMLEVSQIIAVELHSAIAIKNIYSPSHKIDISQRSDYLATVSYEGKSNFETSDFILYYGLDENYFGVNLLTHRSSQKEEGFFMLLMSPKVKIPKYQILDKDVVFVLDVSGSMAGDKIEQAKEALKYCINNLGKKDRFNIITFSTEAKLFRQNLVNALEFRKHAWKFLERIKAKRGTNINEALLTALDMKGDDGRSRGIVFITDGLPTVGITDVRQIRKNIARLNINQFRIFTFGVGYDVNTLLLDGIAQDSHAAADYIEPIENIENTISSFYEKISSPVISSLDLDFETIEVSGMYPKELPDLFKGSQITVMGRYKNFGEIDLRLSGQMSKELRSFEYRVKFPQIAQDNEFLPRLWATRKIGYLMEQIKLSSENKELRDEIVDLSKKYGVVTPYTSYLVLEDQETQLVRLPDGGSNNLFENFVDIVYGSLSLSESVGKQAVISSKASRKLKEAEAVDLFKSNHVRHLGNRTFVLDQEGYWTDLEFKPSEKSLNIKYASEAYFRLLKTYPKTVKLLSLGRKVIFKSKDKFIKVDEAGKEKITQAELNNYFSN